jgi:hypothetical protein
MRAGHRIIKQNGNYDEHVRKRYRCCHTVSHSETRTLIVWLCSPNCGNTTVNGSCNVLSLQTSCMFPVHGNDSEDDQRCKKGGGNRAATDMLLSV